jgi:DNA invertase Pin-like site-specific DNA recombinase
MLEAKKIQQKVEIYTDKGFSGSNLERAGFKRMMEDVKAGRISTVIVYKLDRISRSVVDFVNTYAIFKNKNVDFISCTERFDTTTDIGEAMLKIAVVFAELERKTIQQRVADAYADRSRKGYYMGGRVPYGFNRVPITLGGIRTSMYEPIPEEIGHIRTIFEMYARPATSLSDIVRFFKDKGIQKTRGIEWSTSRLTEILRNPIYVKADVDVYNFYRSRGTEIVNEASDFIGECGCYLYTKRAETGKDKDVKPTKKEKDKHKNMSHYSGMMLVLAPHAGVIDSDVFIKCRLKAEQNSQIPNAKKSYTTWISGKLKCMKCGYAMRYNCWRGKTTENEYYICSAVSDKKCTGVGAVHKSKIEDVVFKAMVDKVRTLRVEQSKPSANQSEINSLKAVIAAKETEIDKILTNFAVASPTIIERMNKAVDRLTGEISDLYSRIDRLEQEQTTKTQLDTAAIEKIFDQWVRVSKEDKRKMVDILIKRVLVSKEKIEIQWKI